MDFTPSERVTELLERVNGFLDEHYYPRERELVEALDELRRCAATQFDPALVEAFVTRFPEQARSPSLGTIHLAMPA